MTPTPTGSPDGIGDDRDPRASHPWAGGDIGLRLARAAVDLLHLDAAMLARREDGELVVEAAWRDAPSVARLEPEGAVGRAMSEGRTVVGPPPRALGADAKVAVASPVRCGRDVRGVLLGLADPPGPPEDGTVPRALEVLAELAGLELEIVEARGGRSDAERRLASLVEAGMALAGELTLDELLTRLVDTARQVLGARYAALGVVDEERTGLANFVTSGVSEQDRAAIGDLPRGRGLLGVLIRDAEPLRLERISDDPRSVGFPPNHPPMESFLGVPVGLRGEVYGNLYLTEKVGGPFTEEDEQVARTLAAQAAVTVDNVRRYEAERRRVAELESVQEVARAVLVTLDLDQLLPLVARHVRRLTGADTVGVAMVEEGGLAFRYAHGVGALALESLRAPAQVEALPARLQEALGTEWAEVAPLEVGGETVGVLAAVSRTRFDEAARRLLATFSSQVAIAVANARAFAAERERLIVSAEVQAAKARERAAEEGLRRAVEAQEAERARIARELHDEAGQVLTGLALHLRGLEGEMGEGEGSRRLAELRRSVTQAAESLRELATRLRPGGLEQGLRGAIERQAARVRESAAIPVDVALDALPAGLPEEIEVVVFRVVQEALTNVVRHSGATRASVIAASHEGRLRVVVEDDGRGFDPEAPTVRMGLAGIRERVELIGGQLRIESAPGAGTAVIVDLQADR